MTLKIPVATWRVFEAAARRQSFHAAAAELNLTPSAVSHSIRKLEETLGVLLFERVGRGVSLSSEGQTLMGYTERAFEELQRGVEAVSARMPRLLRLHCAPSFAAQWLTPRLARFFARSPELEVRLSAGVEYARFDTGEFDADIIYGLPRQEGLVVLPLKEERVTPLCAPPIAEEIESPTDLLRHPLIQSDNKQVRWPAWFGLNGIAVPSSSRGSRFDRSFLAIAAAADGLGVALESTLLAEREIARGRLVAPLAGRSEDVRYVGHRLVYPRPFEQRAPLRIFAQWLARELEIVLTPFV
jgi:LysR family transcriptional regulator, glycine cleavage system transcriptional activator